MPAPHSAEYSGTMAGQIQRVAMVAMHSSPAAAPGTALAAELATRGVEVQLLTRATGIAARRELLAGVTLHELEAGPLVMLAKDRLASVTDEFGEAVASLARTQQYDLLHAHYWLSGIAVLPVAIELGLPLVQSFHTLAAMKNVDLGSPEAPDATPEPELRVRSEAFIASEADALVAASSAEASALIDLAGAPADRTWIIPPGVDLALFAPRPASSAAAVRHRLGLEPERPIAVLAGRVQPLKGHELAVRALGELRKLRGSVPLLVIAGEATPGDEGFLALLRALAQELEVGSDVRFVGALERETLADLLSAATVTVVPSFSETFGLVALESAASGTPVLGFCTGGLTESIAEGVSGLVLGTRDPRYWASEIAVMIDNAGRRADFALTARAFAERFTWGAAATGLLGVYAGVGRP